MGYFGGDKEPKEPNYGASTKAGIEAWVENLPEILRIQGEYGPELDRLNLESLKQTAPEMAQLMLDVQKEFGDAFVDQRLHELERSDPAGFEIRQKLGDQVKADLERGGDLDPKIIQQIEDQVRGGQAARGNILGQAAVSAEATQTGDAAFRVKQQSLANAGAFLSGTTPTAQFGQLSGAQGGAAPFAPINPSQAINQGQAMQGGAGFAQQSYAGASSNYQAGLAAGNPWTTGLGMLGGIGVTAATGGIGGALTGIGFAKGAGGALGG